MAFMLIKNKDWAENIDNTIDDTKIMDWDVTKHAYSYNFHSS